MTNRSITVEPLEEVTIEEAATRPPMLPLFRLPLKIGMLVLGSGAVLFVLVSSTMGQVIVVGTTLMVCAALRPFVAVDYNGFDIFIVWLRLDLTCLDTRVWGGTRAAPFPLRVSGYYGMSSRRA